jgi:hypothetical protein
MNISYEIKKYVTQDEINSIDIKYKHIFNQQNIIDYVNYYINLNSSLCLLFKENEKIIGCIIGSKSFLYSKTSQKIDLPIIKNKILRKLYLNKYISNKTNDIENTDPIIKINLFLINYKLSNNTIKHLLNLFITEFNKENIDDSSYISFQSSSYHITTNRMRFNNNLKKYLFFRPINLNKLRQNNILFIEKDILIYDKLYTTFSYSYNLKRNKIINIKSYFEENYINTLYNIWNIKYKQLHDCFDLIDFNEYKTLFNNDLFYHFIIYDSDNNITDHLCFKKIIYYNNCISAEYYLGFFENKTVSYIDNIFEFIAEYILKNNINIPIDMISKYDNFSNFDSKFMKTLNINFQYLLKIDNLNVSLLSSYETVNLNI